MGYALAYDKTKNAGILQVHSKAASFYFTAKFHRFSNGNLQIMKRVNLSLGFAFIADSFLNKLQFMPLFCILNFILFVFNYNQIFIYGSNHDKERYFKVSSVIGFKIRN